MAEGRRRLRAAARRGAILLLPLALLLALGPYLYLRPLAEGLIAERFESWTGGRLVCRFDSAGWFSARFRCIDRETGGGRVLWSGTARYAPWRLLREQVDEIVFDRESCFALRWEGERLTEAPWLYFTAAADPLALPARRISLNDPKVMLSGLNGAGEEWRQSRRVQGFVEQVEGGGKLFVSLTCAGEGEEPEAECTGLLDSAICEADLSFHASGFAVPPPLSQRLSPLSAPRVTASGRFSAAPVAGEEGWSLAVFAEEVTLAAEEADLSAEELSISGLLLPGENHLAFRGDLNLSGASAGGREGADWRIDGVAARVPVGWDARTRASRFSLNSFHAGGREWPGLSGELRCIDERGEGGGGGVKVEFDGDWPLLPGAAVAFRGAVELSGVGAEGESSFLLAPAELADAGALAQILPEGASLSGRLSASGAAGGQWSGDALALHWKVRAAGEGIALSLPAQRLKAKGLSFDAHFGSARPGSEEPVSQLRFAALSLGEIGLGTGEADFALRCTDAAGWVPDRIVVDAASAAWMGGRLSAQNIEIDPQSDSLSFVMEADGLNLSDLFAALWGAKAEGAGLLSGRVPLRLKRDGSIEVGTTAYLAAAEAARGTIRIHDTGLLTAALEQDPRFRTDPALAGIGYAPTGLELVKEKIVDGLTDFAYDRLRLDLALQADGGAVARVETGGQGRTGRDPQVFKRLTLLFPGADRELARLLFGAGGTGRIRVARWGSQTESEVKE